MTVPNVQSDKPEAPERRAQLRAVPGGRADDDSDPVGAAPKEPLDPLTFYTVEAAADYLDIGTQRMYQILRADPPKLPHKREPGARGRDEYRISGRELNVFRYRRTKGDADTAQSE
jgi:hypothetical protein